MPGIRFEFHNPPKPSEFCGKFELDEPNGANQTLTSGEDMENVSSSGAHVSSASLWRLRSSERTFKCLPRLSPALIRMSLQRARRLFAAFTCYTTFIPQQASVFCCRPASPKE
jgi:hypothetical protein